MNLEKCIDVISTAIAVQGGACKLNRSPSGASLLSHSDAELSCGDDEGHSSGAEGTKESTSSGDEANYEEINPLKAHIIPTIVEESSTQKVGTN